eukprot:IDg926t1
MRNSIPMGAGTRTAVKMTGMIDRCTALQLRANSGASSSNVTRRFAPRATRHAMRQSKRRTRALSLTSRTCAQGERKRAHGSAKGERGRQLDVGAASHDA